MKTNLFKAITAASTAALMLAIPVSSAYAAGPVSNTPKTDEFRTDDDTFDSSNGATCQGNVNILIDNDTLPDSSTDDTAVYRVEVDWTSLDFTYKSPMWDPDNHEYKGGEWYVGTTKTNKGTITVTNHSNWGISYSALFGTSATSKTENNVKAVLSNNTGDITYCAPAGTAPSATATVTVGLDDTTAGIPTEDSFLLDTITVKITPDADWTRSTT